MSGKIFINYRRGDDPGFAGRLFDRLEAHFSQDQLFIDVDHIGPGLDFVRVLEEQVAKCDVLLAVIGRGWIGAVDENGAKRLNNPNDFVRIEIEGALRLQKLVIPVLVNGADMPRADQLPESLKPLAQCNAVRLTYERFKSDAQGLIKALTTALEKSETARSLAAEQEQVRLRRMSAEAEALSQVEKDRARQSAIAGLSPEQISKAEELANWEFVKDNPNPQEFRDHVARFPKGVTERMARAKLEALVWQGMGAQPEFEQVEGFLEEFPDGLNASTAKERLVQLQAVRDEARQAEAKKARESDAWAEALTANSRTRLLSFLTEYPEGRFTEKAKAKLVEIDAADEEAVWRTTQDMATPEAYRAYLAANPRSRFVRDARTALASSTKSSINYWLVTPAVMLAMVVVYIWTGTSGAAVDWWRNVVEPYDVGPAAPPSTGGVMPSTHNDVGPAAPPSTGGVMPSTHNAEQEAYYKMVTQPGFRPPAKAPAMPKTKAAAGVNIPKKRTLTQKEKWDCERRQAETSFKPLDSNLEWYERSRYGSYHFPAAC